MTCEGDREIEEGTRSARQAREHELEICLMLMMLLFMGYERGLLDG